MEILCILTHRVLRPGMRVVLLPLLPGTDGRWRPALLPLFGTRTDGGVVLGADAHTSFLMTRTPRLDPLPALAAALVDETPLLFLGAVQRRIARDEAPAPAAERPLRVAWMHRDAWTLLTARGWGPDGAAPHATILRHAELAPRLLRRLGFAFQGRDREGARRAVGRARYGRRYVDPCDPAVTLWSDGVARVRVTRDGARVGRTCCSVAALARALAAAGSPLPDATLAWARDHTTHELDVDEAAREYRMAVRARREVRQELRDDPQGAWELVASTMPAGNRKAFVDRVRARVDRLLGGAAPAPKLCVVPTQVRQTFVNRGAATLRVQVEARQRADGTFGPAQAFEVRMNRRTPDDWPSLAAEPVIPFPDALWQELTRWRYRTPRPYRLPLLLPWFRRVDDAMPHLYGRHLFTTFRALTVALDRFLDNLARLPCALAPSERFEGAHNAMLEAGLAALRATRG